MSKEAQQDLVFVLASDKQYWRYILTALCILSIMYSLFRFTQHSWSKFTLGAYVVDNALFAIVFFVMASETNLLSLNQDAAIISPDNPNSVRWATEFVTNGISWTLMIIGTIAAGIAGYYGWLLTKLK